MQTIRTNLTNAASTQYSNFNFTSMCLFNGVILGAGPDGLRKLCCGTDDAGTDIAAYFIPATSNFGAGKKRARYAYFDFACSESMQISLTGDGLTTIGPYAVAARAGLGDHRVRVSMARGLQWGYGSFRVENVSGSSFSIDAIYLQIDEKKFDRR